MTLFLITLLFLALLLSYSSVILCLLLLLVYLGALIVLFSYLWMYINFSSRMPLVYFFIFILLFFIFPLPVLESSSQYSFMTPSSFILFLGTLLFFAIVVVVSVLDISLGGFSS